MISDALMRLSGTRTVSAGVVTNTPQTISAATPANPLLSTHWVDLADALNNNRSNGNMAGADMHGVFSVRASVTSGTANNTLEMQLISTPRTVATGQTFTCAVTTGLCTIASGGAFLPNGTLVTVSTATTLPAGMAAATHYFVVGATVLANDDQTFFLASTPDGATRAGASTFVGTTTGTGTHTILHIPQVIATSGPVPLARLRASRTNPPHGGQVADQIVVCSNPLPLSPVAPLHRYLMARYVLAAGTLTGGSMMCDVGCGVPANRSIQHASGFFVG